MAPRICCRRGPAGLPDPEHVLAGGGGRRLLLLRMRVPDTQPDRHARAHRIPPRAHAGLRLSPLPPRLSHQKGAQDAHFPGQAQLMTGLTKHLDKCAVDPALCALIRHQARFV
jgi:hypothetical protein